LERKITSGMLTLLLTSMLTLAFSAYMGDALYAFGVTEGTMYFDPASVSGLAIDDTFSLFVMFKDFTNLYTWQVEIGFDPTKLMVADFQGGPELPDSVFKVLALGRFTLWMKGAIDNTAGYIYYSAEALTGAGGVNGAPGVGYKLMRINFKVKGFAPLGTEVYLDRGLKTYWVDGAGVKKYAATGVATISTVAPPAPYSPKAKFSWTPSFPKQGETITFDASASTSGFNGTVEFPITEYRWNFDGVPGWENVSDSPIATWNYASVGFHPVTLEVWAAGSYPPGVSDTNSTTTMVQVVMPVGAEIDVYTQKAPYDGKGPNAPSDAFAPQERVILYANVTYNDDPRADILVAFQVIDAAGQNVLYRAATTHVDGIATIDYRIPHAPAFGTWQVVARASVKETLINDTLTFQVGWVVEITRVEIVDAQNVSITSLMQGEKMRFRVSVKNIAMTDKNATLSIYAFDNSSTPLGQVIVENQRIPPGNTSYYIGDLLIPNRTRVGIGVAFVSAYSALPTLGGVPWCPEVSTTFEIKAKVLRDVAIVSVEPSPTKVYQGGVVNITVVVKNKGKVSESFNVSAFYDRFSIGTLPVENLAVDANKTLSFYWNTSSVVTGQYNISAWASPVSEETNLADNTFVYGLVDVLPPPPPPPPPVTELSWLLLLMIILVTLVGASLFGFLVGRKTRKRESSPQKYAYRRNPYRNYEKRTNVAKKPLGVHICPHCGKYSALP